MLLRPIGNRNAEAHSVPEEIEPTRDRDSTLTALASIGRSTGSLVAGRPATWTLTPAAGPSGTRSARTWSTGARSGAACATVRLTFESGTCPRARCARLGLEGGLGTAAGFSCTLAEVLSCRFAEGRTPFFRMIEGSALRCWTRRSAPRRRRSEFPVAAWRAVRRRTRIESRARLVRAESSSPGRRTRRSALGRLGAKFPSTAGRAIRPSRWCGPRSRFPFELWLNVQSRSWSIRARLWSAERPSRIRLGREALRARRVFAAGTKRAWSAGFGREAIRPLSRCRPFAPIETVRGIGRPATCVAELRRRLASFSGLDERPGSGLGIGRLEAGFEIGSRRGTIGLSEIAIRAGLPCR